MQAHSWDPFQTLSGPSCRPATGFTNVAGKEHENCSKIVNFVSWNLWKSVYKQYKTIIQLHLGYTSIQASKTARRNARSDCIFRFLWGNSCVENCHCYWDYNMQRALMGAENVCFDWNYSLFFDCFFLRCTECSFYTAFLVRKTRPKKKWRGFTRARPELRFSGGTRPWRFITKTTSRGCLVCSLYFSAALARRIFN